MLGGGLSSCRTAAGPAQAFDPSREASARCACEQPAADKQPPTARAALAAFLDAAERGDFEVAYRLLAAPWRARYTPERLASDFRAEPLARERLARARGALSSLTSAQAAEAPLVEFSLGGGRSVRLAREADGYRVVALE